MTKCPPWFRVIAVATCWLTFLAGADDFNLARVLLPLPAQAPDSPLPDDDPNTDYTDPSGAPGPTAAARPAGPSLSVSADLRLARTGLPAPVPPPARPPSVSAGTNVPLRC
jgi:hypothetical protein